MAGTCWPLPTGSYCGNATLFTYVEGAVTAAAPCLHGACASLGACRPAPACTDAPAELAFGAIAAECLPSLAPRPRPALVAPGLDYEVLNATLARLLEGVSGRCRELAETYYCHVVYPSCTPGATACRDAVTAIALDPQCRYELPAARLEQCVEVPPGPQTGPVVAAWLAAGVIFALIVGMLVTAFIVFARAIYRDRVPAPARQ